MLDSRILTTLLWMRWMLPCITLVVARRQTIRVFPIEAWRARVPHTNPNPATADLPISVAERETNSVVSSKGFGPRKSLDAAKWAKTGECCQYLAIPMHVGYRHHAGRCDPVGHLQRPNPTPCFVDGWLM